MSSSFLFVGPMVAIALSWAEFFFCFLVNPLKGYEKTLVVANGIVIAFSFSGDINYPII